MQSLPLEILEHIETYRQIRDDITDNMTKEQIQELVTQRCKYYVKDCMSPFKYMWTSFDANGIRIIVRVSVECNENISQIVLYNLKTQEMRSWSVGDDITPRNPLDLPMRGRNRYYGHVRIHYPKNDTEHVIIGDDEDDDNIKIEKDRFDAFLLGHDDDEILRIVRKRRQFLEYDIIERLASNATQYYRILKVFEGLYNMGYWTYGGFKDYKPTNTTFGRKNTFVKCILRENIGFNLSVDGYVTNIVDKDGKLEETLDKLYNELDANIVY